MLKFFYLLYLTHREIIRCEMRYIREALLSLRKGLSKAIFPSQKTPSRSSIFIKNLLRFADLVLTFVFEDAVEVIIQYFYFDKFLTSFSAISVANSVFLTLFAAVTMIKFISM